MRKINKLIVHCSATPEYKNFDVNDIREWHVKGNGWSDCGYHYVIKLDGTLQEGRPVEKIGAHCAGHNRDSIGVCYIGGMDKNMKEWKDTRTPEQTETLHDLLHAEVLYPFVQKGCLNALQSLAHPLHFPRLTCIFLYSSWLRQIQPLWLLGPSVNTPRFIF